MRERLLSRLLGAHYASVFRRRWIHADSPPHFFSHRINAFRFGFGDEPLPPASFYRGFFSSEVIRPGDDVLDIGCGDGFFTKRFLSVTAGHVDGVDIDATAIEEARTYNSAPNVDYVLLDAVDAPFPRPRYDIVIWDGAIGHFAAETTDAMLAKIKDALKPGGIFAGSESLGDEGTDHLQYFASLDALGRLFSSHWNHVFLREVSYSTDGAFTRREAFWRCADDAVRLQHASWTKFR